MGVYWMIKELLDSDKFAELKSEIIAEFKNSVEFEQEVIKQIKLCFKEQTSSFSRDGNTIFTGFSHIESEDFLQEIKICHLIDNYEPEDDGCGNAISASLRHAADVIDKKWSDFKESDYYNEERYPET